MQLLDPTSCELGRGRGERTACRRLLKCLGRSSLLVAAGFAGGTAAAQPAPVDAVEFQINTSTLLPQFDPAIAIDGDGNFVIAWTSYPTVGGDQNGDGIRLRRFGADGFPRDPFDIQVNLVTGSHQRRSAIASDSEGNFVVVWQSPFSAGGDTDGRSVQARRFSSSGLPLDPVEFQVNTRTLGSQEAPSVGVDARGDLFIAWESYGSFGNDDSGTSIQVRRFRADGSPIDATEFQVNTYTPGFQHVSSIAVDASGAFVVVWQTQFSPHDHSDTSLRGRRFDRNGVPLDATDFPINTVVAGYQLNPSVTTSLDAGFVVAWESFSSAGTDSDLTSIQARRFAATGVPEDPTEFQVNTQTVWYQATPRVVADSERNFVIVWDEFSAKGDGSGASVQFRRFRTTGEPIDATDYAANELTSGNQFGSDVAVALDGRILAAWYSSVSAGNDMDESVQARRFETPEISVHPASNCMLEDAIVAANSGEPTGGCPGGSGGAVLSLAANHVYSLAVAVEGSNGLPVVRSTVRIRGNGAILQRDPGLACPASPQFRILEVADGGVLTLEDLLVRNGCLASNPGGALYSSGGGLRLREVSVEGNESAVGGGIAVDDGSLVVVDSSIAENLATGPGGGVTVSGPNTTALVRRSSILRNSSSTGAGLVVDGGAIASVRSSTVSGNGADAEGGGILIGGALTQLDLEFVTIAANSASSGAAVHLQGGTTALHNSVAGESGAGVDCSASSGVMAASGRNFDTDGTCAALAGGGIQQVDALELEPLSDNGGSTHSHLPRAGSPLLDASPDCASRRGAHLGFDQRGYPRPTDDDALPGPQCDLGAVERGPIFLDGFSAGDLRNWSAADP